MQPDLIPHCEIPFRQQKKLKSTRMDGILDAFNVEYLVHLAPGDGDCFYHAVSQQLNRLLSPHGIRNLVAEFLTDEDAMLHNAIHDTKFDLERLKEEIRQPRKWWGDAIEINSLCRAIPHINIYIFDDEFMSVTQHSNVVEQDNVSQYSIFLRRRHYHYESIEFATPLKKIDEITNGYTEFSISLNKIHGMAKDYNTVSVSTECIMWMFQILYLVLLCSRYAVV